jgi:hypothetical protein
MSRHATPGHQSAQGSSHSIGRRSGSIFFNNTGIVEVPSSIIGAKVVFTPAGIGTFVLVGG